MRAHTGHALHSLPGFFAEAEGQLSQICVGQMVPWLKPSALPPDGKCEVHEVLHVRLGRDGPDGAVEPDVGDVDVESLSHLLVGLVAHRGDR